MNDELKSFYFRVQPLAFTISFYCPFERERSTLVCGGQTLRFRLA
jgi:hypothetical protein